MTTERPSLQHRSSVVGDSAGQNAPVTDARVAWVQERLRFLRDLGCGLMESGTSTAQTRRMLHACADRIGLDGVSIHTFGRRMTLRAAPPNDRQATVTGRARTLDLIDCTRAKRLSLIADGAAAADLRAVGQPSRDRLRRASQSVYEARRAKSPWWVTTLGMTMLAFFISQQVGVSWQAWAAAVLVQIVSSATGLGTNLAHLPRSAGVAVQSSAAGAFATLLVQIGFVDPLGAAAAIAVNWLLLLPLPQLISAVTDTLGGDLRSSMIRISSVIVAGVGIVVGGMFTFALGEFLHMDHPRLEVLPILPWYLVLAFSALGAIGNALANGGRLPLVWPAAALGFATAAINQTLLGAGLPALWANAVSALMLGMLTGVVAKHVGYPRQVLALMGVTGALLPGIPVFFGILQSMGGGNGIPSFADAALVSLCIGVCVPIGVAVHDLCGLRRRAETGQPRAGL